MKIESRLQVTTFFSILCSFKLLAHLAIHKQYIVHSTCSLQGGIFTSAFLALLPPSKFLESTGEEHAAVYTEYVESVQHVGKMSYNANVP